MKQSILTITLFSLLLLGSVGLTSCGSNSAQAAPQNTPVPKVIQSKAMGYSELIAQLRAVGATVVPGTGINQPFMNVDGRTLAVNGEQIQVYEYASVSYANKQASYITPDGTAFTTVSSSGTPVSAAIVDWVKPPHFYKAGRLIVIYVGSNNGVIHLLVRVLGKQFAGR